MMHGHEKSDSAIVATKPPNKAGQPAAEAVERRAEAKENANDAARAGHSAGKACPWCRSAYGRPRPAVKHPRWEPYAGKLHVRLCVQ